MNQLVVECMSQCGGILELVRFQSFMGTVFLLLGSDMHSRRVVRYTKRTICYALSSIRHISAERLLL